MPRKSSESPPATCNLFHVSPFSTDFRMTPFEPDAQTTRTRAARGFGPALTPRRFVAIPLVCTFHDCATAEGWKKRKSRVRKRKKLLGAIVDPFILFRGPD